MKMAKRIFIALLIVSVFVSVFALTASAAGSNDIDYDYLLEYFEEPVLFEYDFTGEDIPYSLFTNSDDAKRITSEFVSDENAPVGKYLSVTVPASQGFWEDVIAKNNVYFNWNAEEAPIDDFILEMTVSGERGTGDEQQLPKIIVSVADETCTDSDVGSKLGTTLLAVDYRVGHFSYLKRTADSEGNVSGVLTNTEFVLTEGSWYNVYVAYSSDEQTATITVTDLADATNTYTVNDAYLPYTDIRNIRVGAHGVDGATARDSVMNFASLRALGGKYDRDGANMQSDVETALLDMYADFTSDDVSFEVKDYIAGVASKLFVYGFTTENEEAAAAYAELVKGVVSYCNDQLAYYIETYDKLVDYSDRRELINEALRYVSYINSPDCPAIPEDIADDVALNLELIEALNVTLDKIAENSVLLVSAVGGDTTANYDDYPSVLARFNELHIYGQFADPTYEGTLDAYVFYATLLEAKEHIELNATRFIEAANVLNSSADFNTRAQAFLVCKNNYYDNTTYPGLSAALAIYNAHYNAINTQIENAENFIKFVQKADYADYIPQKLDHLADAEKYMAYCLTADPYNGVMEAKELYDRVKAEVQEKLKNAELYINAVKALASLSGDALLEGIEKAEGLKAAGNVLGVDGVSEANIQLDEIVSGIQLSVQYRDYFVRLVDSIDTATDAKQLYKILKNAKNAEKDADSTYAAVADASAKLAKAIADFNAQVASANAEFEKANEVAANVMGIGKQTNPVADRVIALIKKFFDEE